MILTASKRGLILGTTRKPSSRQTESGTGAASPAEAVRCGAEQRPSLSRPRLCYLPFSLGGALLLWATFANIALICSFSVLHFELIRERETEYRGVTVFERSRGAVTSEERERPASSGHGRKARTPLGPH